MTQPKCSKCNDTGKLTCQRCINGTPKDDKYYEQGGWAWGCAECHGFKRVFCKCTHLGGINYGKDKGKITE